MRLDRYVAFCTGKGRAAAKRAIAAGRVSVDGAPVKRPEHHLDVRLNEVWLGGEKLEYRQYVYILLHKPAGYVCSAVGEGPHPPVLELLPTRLRHRALHFAGRLDADVTGLLLLSDDGKWTHRITSPKHELEKHYLVHTADPLSGADVRAMADGLRLRGDAKPTRPAELTLRDTHTADLVIREGRYHQVKRMFAAVGNRVEALMRLSVGGIELPPDLPEGEFRELSREAAEAVFTEDAPCNGSSHA